MIQHEEDENSSISNNNNKISSPQENNCCINLDDAASNSNSNSSIITHTTSEKDNGHRCHVDFERNSNRNGNGIGDDSDDKQQRRCCNCLLQNLDTSLMKCILINLLHYCRILLLIVTSIGFSRYIVAGNASNVGITFRVLIIFFWTTHEMRYCILRRLKLNDIYDGEDDDDVAHVRVVKATERDTFANSTTLKIDDGCTSKDSRAVDVVISFKSFINRTWGRKRRRRRWWPCSNSRQRKSVRIETVILGQFCWVIMYLLVDPPALSWILPGEWIAWFTVLGHYVPLFV